MKVWSLVMRSVASLPVSSKVPATKPSVPAAGGVVSTLKPALDGTADTVMTASLPAASRTAPPLSTRLPAGMEIPSMSARPGCTT